MRVRLRDRYDVGTQVSANPLVQVIDGFVSDTECAHIIGLCHGRLDTAMVSAVGEATTSDGRTGSVAWIKHDETPIVSQLVERVSELVGIPVDHAESLQVVHYAMSEEYKPHFDAYDMDTEKGRQRTAKGGQRLVTALMYLNDVERGGGTLFPMLDMEIEAQPGRLVLFHDVGDHTLGDMTRHPHSLHGGSPVQAGEKWACNLWFRAHEYQAVADGA